MDKLNERYMEVKRKRDEMIEREKLYPNIYNRKLPDWMPCADFKNIDKCRKTLTKYCPARFLIDNIMYEKNRTDPVCRWVVEYIPENGTLPEEGDALKTLVNLILNNLPYNCVAMGRGLVEKERVRMYYVVTTCECPNPFFEEADIKSPLYLLDNLRL